MIRSRASSALKRATCSGKADRQQPTAVEQRCSKPHCSVSIDGSYLAFKLYSLVLVAERLLLRRLKPSTVRGGIAAIHSNCRLESGGGGRSNGSVGPYFWCCRSRSSRSSFTPDSSRSKSCALPCRKFPVDIEKAGETSMLAFLSGAHLQLSFCALQMACVVLDICETSCHRPNGAILILSNGRLAAHQCFTKRKDPHHLRRMPVRYPPEEPISPQSQPIARRLVAL